MASSYRDQQAWKDLQQYLPEQLRLDDSTAPAEEYWQWRDHVVHLDTYRNPQSPVKLILHHGVGTNGRQMSLILGAPLARRGWETIAVDNLGYGLTEVSGTPTYDDWVRLTADLVAAEQAKDDRPIVLYGLSAGGMLTYHVASVLPPQTLAGIIGMTFLDQRVQRVRDETAHDKLSSRVGIPAMGLIAKTPFGKIKYPMTLASKMSALANEQHALKLLLKDRTSAGNWVSLRFLHDYMTYQPAVEPADFAACPVVLTAPTADRWTPKYLSDPVLNPITRVPVEVHDLEGAGHLPLEDLGLRQLEEITDAYLRRVSGNSATAAG